MSARVLACISLTIVLLVFAKDQGPGVALVTTVGMVILALRFFMLPRLLSWRLSERGQRTLNVVLVAGLWLALLACFMTHFVPPKLFLPIAILGGVWFLLEKESERLVDTLFVTLVGFFAVVVLVISEPVSFLVINERPITTTAPLAAVLAYLLMTAYGLLDQERVRELARAHSPGGSIGRDHAPRVAWLVIAVGLALVIPDPDQIGSRDESGSGLATTTVVGFNNSVNYDLFGTLKNDSSLAMTVKLESDSSAMTLEEDWYYNNRTFAFQFRGGTLGQQAANGFEHYESVYEPECPSPQKLERLGLEADHIVQTLSVAPHQGRELFALANALNSDNLKLIVNHGLIHAPTQVTENTAYVVHSLVLTTKSRDELRRFNVGHKDDMYTAWNEGPRYGKVKALAASLCGSDAARGSYYTKVLAIEDYLSSGKEYAYDRRVPNYGRHALEGFLFNEEKRGTCIYFAGAMVMLLRSQGIPCRLVTGFRGATFSKRLNAFKVLSSNAHAWVEVCFERVGWVAFDPTPKESRLDAGLVINPADSETTRKAIGGPRSESEPLAVDLALVEEARLPWWWPFAAGGGGLLLLIVIRRLVQRRFSEPEAPEMSAEEAEHNGQWQLFIKVLKQRGAKPERSKTLRELVAEASPLRAAEQRSVNDVCSMLYLGSYGGRPFEARKVAEALAQLQANDNLRLRKPEHA